jgi:hypothetical protein
MEGQVQNKPALPLIRQKQGKELVREDLKEATSKNGFLIDGVMYDDIDKSFQDAIKNDFQLIDDRDSNSVVPVTFYNSTYRWTEFQNTWMNSDHNKNIKMPFISIIRKPNPQQGTQRGGYWNIPGRRHYSLYKVPTFDGNREGFDLFKVPQPMPVDIEYEVKLFSYSIELLNDYNQIFLNKYKSYEYYIKPKGLWMKTLLESVDDESQLSNIDSRKYYVQTMRIKICGYILDPKDFIIEKALTRVIGNIQLNSKTSNGYKDEPIGTLGVFNKKIEFLEGVNNQTISFKATSSFNITNISDLINITTIDSIVVDNSTVLNNYSLSGTLTEPISVDYGDKVMVNITKTDIINGSSFIINCENK